VHFAGSFDIPCIALFGPTDGKLRTKDYKNCHVLTVKEKLNCVPCWRNENIPCKLTGGKGSVCMEGIYSEEIVDLCLEISTIPLGFLSSAQSTK
jgi:ADP-heptose:LPS heptosyltransferase